MTCTATHCHVFFYLMTHWKLEICLSGGTLNLQSLLSSGCASGGRTSNTKGKLYSLLDSEFVCFIPTK